MTEEWRMRKIFGVQNNFPVSSFCGCSWFRWLTFSHLLFSSVKFRLGKSFSHIEKFEICSIPLCCVSFTFSNLSHYSLDDQRTSLQLKKFTRISILPQQTQHKDEKNFPVEKHFKTKFMDANCFRIEWKIEKSSEVVNSASEWWKIERAKCDEISNHLKLSNGVKMIESIKNNIIAMKILEILLVHVTEEINEKIKIWRRRWQEFSVCYDT